MTAATPEEIRQIANDVLARPEFLERQTWTELLFDRILKWVGDLAQWSARNPDLSKLLTTILTIVLILMIAHIVYTMVREFTLLRKPGGGRPPQQRLRALEGVAENWNEAFRLARAALEGRDVYRAIWITHRVLLSVLDRMGWIKFVRWKTNTDYLHECRDNGDARATLRALTAAYDRVIYAHIDLGCAEAAQLLARVESLAAEAGQ
jgi:hypothetical protein